MYASPAFILLPSVCYLLILETRSIPIASNEQVILRADDLKKSLQTSASQLVLFENLSFQIAQGEMLAIVGESGTGKSTLLHILGALDRAS